MNGLSPRIGSYLRAALLGAALIHNAGAFELLNASALEELPPGLIFASQLARGIAVAADGTIVIGGTTRSVVDFDPSPDILLIESANDSPYVAIYPPAGNPIVHVFENPRFVIAKGRHLALDDAGNIYFAGEFSDDLGVGDGLPDLTGAGSDVFVARLDSLGVVQWAFVIGNSNTIQSVDALVVRGDQLVIAGSTQSAPVDFDPDPNTEVLAAGNVGRGPESYVASYTTDGALRWVSVFAQLSSTATNQPDAATALAITDSGEVVVGGVFNGSADFDSSAGLFTVTSSSADGYLAQLDNAGLPLWVNQLTSTDSGTANVQKMARDSAGKLIVAGQIIGTVDLDPHPVNQLLLAAQPLLSTDRFIAQYDASGNLEWARLIDAGGVIEFGGIALLGNQRIVVGSTSNFGGATIDFDDSGGAGSHSLGSTINGFMATYTADGAYLDSRVYLAQGSINVGTRLNAVAAANSALHVAGEFSAPFDVDTGPGTVQLTPGGGTSSDIFFAAYSRDALFNNGFESASPANP